MEAFVFDPSQLIKEVTGCITDLKSVNHSSQQPITDDETTLHKFCVKLETVLRHEQKEKYSLMGTRKDYWNFIEECVPKDDSVRYIRAIPQVKTSQGKGRAFIRHALMQKSLADTIQRCLVNKKRVRDWYRADSILQNHSLCTALINKLYDLNDVDFDLSLSGYDLDISWPAFSRRAFGEGVQSGRRSSITSLTSTDFRNERPDPLVGLAAEVSSLKEVFSLESPLAKLNESGENFDDVSIADSTMDQPSVADLTLAVSHVHQQLLTWKADMESRLQYSQREAKRASEELQFTTQESELKIKQLNEKFTNLTKSASDESSARTRVLSETLKSAEGALNEREAEICRLKQELDKSVDGFRNSEKFLIDLERRLASSERELDAEKHARKQVEEGVAAKEKSLCELRLDVERKQGTIEGLQEKVELSKGQLSEVKGELRAKGVALERVQESFEKLNGMVFGSFEELESELKSRLLDKDKGLECQAVENRKLELSMVDIQQHNRQMQKELAEAQVKIQELQTLDYERQIMIEKMELEAVANAQQLEERERFTSQLWNLMPIQEGCNNIEEQNDRTCALLKCLRNLVDDATTTEQSLKTKEDEVSHLRRNMEENDMEIEKLKQNMDVSANQLNDAIKVKDQLERQNMEVSDKLAKMEAEKHSLLSDLTIMSALKAQSDHELSIVKEQQSEEKESRESVEGQLRTVKQQLQEVTDSNEGLQRELAAVVDSHKSLNESTKCQIEDLEGQVTSLQDDKSSLEGEIEVARQQLEAANEARIRAEQANVRAQEQLQSVQCMMDQEVAALEFQLSSETMKYETELKALSAESQESAALRDRVSEHEDTIAELESRVRERHDAWQNDRQKYSAEMKHLKSEVQNYKSSLETSKQRVVSLENELLLATKQLEEEKARQRELKRKMDEANAGRARAEERGEQRLAQAHSDLAEVKHRLVELTREKADLWKKADDMEYEIKLKASDRWVDDSEVNNCSTCRAEFSFLVRKHHCRSCGRIFCYSCANNWVKTAHSRKLKRVCDHCVNSDRKLKSQLVRDRVGTDDSMSDVSLDSSRHRESPVSLDEDTEPSSSNRGQDMASSGTPAKAARNSIPKTSKTGNVTADQDCSSSEPNKSDDDLYTSLSSVETGQRRSLLGRAESATTEDQFEFVDAEDTEIQPGALVVVLSSDVRAEIFIPPIDDERCDFRHVEVSAGTRYVLPVLLGTKGTILCWKFSTSNQSMVFGVAYKATEHTSDDDIQTRLPLAQYACHLHLAKGELKSDHPGVFLLVFDNTHSRSVDDRLLYSVNVKRQCLGGVKSELE